MSLINRKAVFQLLGLIACGALISHILRSQALVGEDVGSSAAAKAVIVDKSPPAAGAAQADVTIIAFTDFGCPACKAAHQAMVRAIASDGKTRVVYKNWPIFGPRSERAARVAIASSFQRVYPAVHDALMNTASLDDDHLRLAVESAGGNWKQIQRDLVERRAEIDAQLNRNSGEAVALGLNGTPAYLIGHFLIRGAISESQFKRAIREARQGA